MASITLGGNIASLFAQRQLGIAGARAATSYERLSSGLRINKASDDPAAAAIASSLSVNSRIFAQSIRNANDIISLTSIAESALDSLQDITVRQKELAEQAASGNYSLSQRRALNSEANELVEEFNRIVTTTKYNGLSILNPQSAPTNYSAQLGAGSANTVAFNTSNDLRRTVGDGTFAVGTTTSSTTTMGEFELIDINNDGNLDLVKASGTNIETKLGAGNGTFAAGTLTPISGLLSNPAKIDSADFNGDGFVDLLVADPNAVGNAKIMLNNGSGTFSYSGSIASSASRGALAVDFNNDGNQDALLVSNAGVSSVFLGNGNGTFGSQITIGVIGEAVPVDSADFNGDGVLDLYAPHSGGYVDVRLGIGDGTFGSKITVNLSQSGNLVGAAGDLNGDGFDDLIVGLASTASRDVGILLSNGDGTFTAGATMGTIGSGAFAIEIKDFNNDGYKDLVYSDSFAASVALGRGDGSFSALTSYAAVFGFATTGDLNNDGALDILTVGQGTTSISILIANTTTTVTAPVLNLLSRNGAIESIGILEDQQNRITAELGTIGAVQSRMEIAASHLASSKLEFDAAYDRITSVDVAEEIARLVSAQVLQQSATAILAQANQTPNLVLQLLDLD